MSPSINIDVITTELNKDDVVCAGTEPSPITPLFYVCEICNRQFKFVSALRVRSIAKDLCQILSRDILWRNYIFTVIHMRVLQRSH